MNKERLEALAQFLESEQYKFDMSTEKGRPDCGAAGCMIGHAAFLWPQFSRTVMEKEWHKEANDWLPVQYVFPNREEIVEYLGLTVEEEDKLFYIGDNSSRYHSDVTYHDPSYRWQDIPAEYDDDGDWTDEILYKQITRAGAIKTLRRFIETEEVLWFKGEQTK